MSRRGLTTNRRALSWTAALKSAKQPDQPAVREVRLRMSAGLRDKPHVVMSSWRGVSGRRYVVIVHDVADAASTRVEGIVGTLQSVASAVTGLSDKLDRRGQTPWGVIWSAVGVGMTVLTVVGGLAFWPVTTGMSDFKAALVSVQERADKRIEGLASNQVTRAEHEVHWRSQDRDYDFMRDRIGRVEGRTEKRLDQMRADQQRLEDRFVSRAELEGRFAAQDRVVGVLRGEVDEHIRAFNERQQHRLDALDNAPAARARP